jgi:hypothetical protein
MRPVSRQEGQIVIRLVLAGALIVALVPPVYSGELDRRRIVRSTSWEPDGCYKPNPPSTYVDDDVQGFNRAVEEYNSYIGDVQIYLKCIVSKAEDDLRIFRIILDDSVDELKSEIISEAESGKRDLERSRDMLD